MVLTGVCVFVIIMSGVKVVSSHGDRPWSFSRMRALARACASEYTNDMYRYVPICADMYRYV